MNAQIQIQYKYIKLVDDQFATFEENYEPLDTVNFHNTVSFSYDYDHNTLICSDTITFIQGEKTLLKFGMSSYFLLHSDCVKELLQDDVLICPKELLWQFASLNYGSMRGVLYERTKDSSLSKLILPPFYFDKLINEGIKFIKKE